MSNTTNNTQEALARHEELVVQEMPDEVLVYDLRRHKAHCLNKTAAFIWQNCDGQRTIPEMTDLLRQKEGSPVNEEVVRYALEKLDKADLLAEKLALPVQDGLSRRRMVRRLGAMLALPAVISIVAPTAVQAATLFTKKIPCGQCNQQDNPAPCANDTCCTGSCGGPQRACFGTGNPATTPGLVDTSCIGPICQPSEAASPCT